MSHLVAGYPTTQLALTAARALVKGGAQTVRQFKLPAQRFWNTVIKHLTV